MKRASRGSRQKQRIAQNDEGKQKLGKILKKISAVYPQLFREFEGEDPRHKINIRYTMRLLLTIHFSILTVANWFRYSAIALAVGE